MEIIIDGESIVVENIKDIIDGIYRTRTYDRQIKKLCGGCLDYYKCWENIVCINGRLTCYREVKNDVA